MYPFFQKHGLGLLFAILVGTVLVVPIIRAPMSIGDTYQGMQYLPHDDEDIYRARINEVLDGYPLITSPYFYEHKDSPVIVPPFNEWLYALLAMCIGLSESIIALKFLLPASLFFLVYLLVYRLTDRDGDIKNTWSVLIASLSTGLWVTLGFDFVNYKYVWNVLHGGATNAIIWSRIVNPIVGAVQLFGFLVLLEAIMSRRFKYAYVCAGVLLSITIGYYFTFGMSLAILGSLFLIVVWRKEWTIAREFAYVGLIGFALSIWYWVKIFLSITGTEGSALGMRNGMSFTHAPIVNLALLAGTVFVVLSATMVYVRYRIFSHPTSWAFVCALLLGSWIAFNQQIITGREVWYGHFFQYSVPLVYVALGVIAYHSWRMLCPRLWLLATMTIMIITSSFGLFSISQVLSREAEFARIQEYAPVLAWLNDNAGKECVIYVRDDNEQLEKLIPAYTSCNVYDTSYNFLGVPVERVEHNFYVDLRMSGVKNDTIAEYMLGHETDVRGAFYTNWKELFDSGKTDWFLKTIENVEQKYPLILQEDMQDMILKYKIDYIISRGNLPEWTLSELPAFSHATSTEQYFIYVK